MNNLSEIIAFSIESGIFDKIILSRPVDKSIIKSKGTLFLKNSNVFLQLETFTTDGKAYHKNYTASECASLLEGLALNAYRQTNIITSAGECEVKISKSGKVFISNKIKPADNSDENTEKAEIKAHDREKKYILDTKNASEFLNLLGICDKDGNIFDKKRSKYKQINKFLSQVESVYSELPHEGTLNIYDFCCGKSYLTFALYFYIHSICKRDVRIVGVDLKKDCIDYCSDVAKQLHFDGMSFICEDIFKYKPEFKPDMTVSLHACDIATDIALAKAVQTGAGVILATPCCHHEMFHQINCKELSFIEDYSMLKQKLCDAATDALRAEALKISGYSVEIAELIDPEETPKNLIIRATYKGVPKNRDEMLEKYKSECDYLGVTPFLSKLLF